MNIERITVASAPARSKLLAWGEFMTLTGVHPTHLGELIDMGWIEPTRTSQNTYLFRRRDVYRARKFARLCADLELSCVGGAIVVDLIERVDALERRVRELERLVAL